MLMSGDLSSSARRAELRTTERPRLRKRKGAISKQVVPESRNSWEPSATRVETARRPIIAVWRQYYDRCFARKEKSPGRILGEGGTAVDEGELLGIGQGTEVAADGSL